MFYRSPAGQKVLDSALFKGASPRGLEKNDKMDPSKMVPAGIKSTKNKQFNTKYSSHLNSELGNQNDFNKI